MFSKILDAIKKLTEKHAIVSVLEPVLQEFEKQVNIKVPLPDIKAFLVKEISAHDIKDMDKKKLILDIQAQQTPQALEKFLYNAILKYEGLGVVKAGESKILEGAFKDLDVEIQDLILKGKSKSEILASIKAGRKDIEGLDAMLSKHIDNKIVQKESKVKENCMGKEVFPKEVDFAPNGVNDPAFKGKMPIKGKVVKDDGFKVSIEWEYEGGKKLVEPGVPKEELTF